MAAIIAFASIAPHRFVALLAQPQLYMHAKLAHILTATMFFANVVIGTLWESRSLASGQPNIIRHTYETVRWLDAFLTAPLILVAVVSGLMLATLMGGVFSMGWLVVALALFVASGIVWLAFDIPSQYRVSALFAKMPADAAVVGPELLRVLRFRRTLNIVAIAPLLAVFALMVHKPPVELLARWLATRASP